MRATGPLYVDTSALLKLYLRELESDATNALLKGRRDILISQLAVTEFVSALARRHRKRVVDATTLQLLEQTVIGHIEAGVYTCIDLAPEDHREAERLLSTAVTVALRAADALHLALALSARVKSVITYDHRMAAATRSLGLTALPEWTR